MFDEPFDTGLDTAEHHIHGGDFAAAQVEYERLLGMAEGLDHCPDVQLLRAHLLANIARVQLARTDLTAAAANHERALGLLRDIASAPMSPPGRQLWLDDLLKALIDKADRLRTAGRLDHAKVCLDEATGQLPAFVDSNGLRDAELGNARVQLLMARGEWGQAEQLGLAVLSTVPATVAAVPHLLASLGQICSATGRLDAAEDYFARAADALLAFGETSALPQFLSYHAEVAARRGDLDRAERMYTEASAIAERQGQLAHLAFCERALGVSAMRRYDPERADRLLAASLARFEQQGMSIAAADTMLMASQLAYGRGDIAEMQRLGERARAVYEAQGVYDRCAQLDFLVAASIEDSLNRSDQDQPAAYAIDAAIALALPAALALDAARCEFATSHARAQWLDLARVAMELAFRLAVRRQDLGLCLELTEFRCAGAPLALDHTPSSLDTLVFPDDATKAYRRLDDPGGNGTDLDGAAETLALGSAAGGAALDAAAGAGLRVALPPKLLMSPGTGRTALREYVELAEARYRRWIVSEQTVPSWVVDGESTRPVVQVRFADAGDLFMSWRWLARVTGIGTGQALKREVDHALDALTAALPSTGDGMRRAFESGAMAAYHSEASLARLLAEALWPRELTEQLCAVSARAGRPLVRIQPSPRVASVPWELLALDDGVRLVDLADVVTTAPLSLSRTGPDWPAFAGERSGAAVLILDPKVPGYPDGSSLGSVLGRPDPALIAMVQRHLDAGDVVPPLTTAAQAFRRTDLDRDWLSAALRAGPRRLMYVGHVSQPPVAGGESEDARLHLCCGAQTYGLAEAVRRHRPLSAKDLFLGTMAARAGGEPGALVWPAPPRVALIACESGGDLRFAESFGLASAMIHNGAQLVTATRWVLPTSHAFHRLGGVTESNRPLSDVIVAVDAAHDDHDPVHRLGVWQRNQLDRWRAHHRIEDSPLLWAAITCIVR